MSKVNKTETCWLWTAGVNASGYGKFGREPTGPELAHRVAYELLVGPIPDGLVLDHLCRVRICVNPAHLEPVTSGENTRRACRGRTHCKRGHEFTPENTYIWGRSRTCVTCRRQYKRQAEKGGGSDEAQLGLVMRGSLAGGQGLPGPPCRYCGEVDGHTAQCPVVS